jgi:hypothetical protein
MEMSTKKKVLCPVESGGDNGKPKKTYWMRIGIAFVNRDGSTNVYLDAAPTNGKLQIRDFDERDLAPRRDRDASTSTDAVPF